MSRRSFSRVFLPLVVLVAVVSVPFVPPARAEGTITTQPYDAPFTFKERDKLGFPGKGITIALTDGPVDTPVLELQGTNITAVTPCPYTPTPDSVFHRTAMVSLLVSPDYGTAPGATILHYAIPLGDEDSTQEDPGCSTDLDLILTYVLNDDANIIFYPVIGLPTIMLRDELIWIDLDGAIVVASMGDDNQEDDARSLASANLTAGVTAVNTQGKRRDYFNYGKGTTVSFYAGPVSTRNYATGQINYETAGTSVATALTSGCLALAMEKWSEAANRQILQSLVRIASRSDGIKWDQWYGYGIINYAALLVEDSRGRPNKNLLLHKNGDWAPNEDLYNDYIDDLLNPGNEVITDPNYIYRGINSNLVSVALQNTACDASL